jgi:hypothetical protein
MGRVRFDDPRFGKALREFSATANTLAEAFDNPPLIRSSLKGDALKNLATALISRLDEALRMTTGQEIASVCGDTQSDLGAMLRLGLTGLKPMTLQEAGDHVGVSRERVRQKQEKLQEKLEQGKPYTPTLDRGLRAIQELLARGIDNVAEIESELRSAGILGEKDTLPQLLAFGGLKGNQRFKLLEAKSIRILVPSRDADAVAAASECARLIAMERTRDFGACPVEAVAHALEENGFSTWASRVPLLLSSVADIEWLEDGAWFRVKRSRNAIANHSRKILAVSPRIRIADLRRGLMRSHRVAHVPPKHVLGKILALELPDLLIEFDGETIVATLPQSPEDILSPLEYELYFALHQHGGIMSREALEREVMAKGMNLSSFHVMIGYSVIIERHAKGVYALRGMAIQPGVVEALLPKGHVRRPSTLDYGHLEDGQIWLVQRLTEASVKYEALSLPAALRQYLGGQYKISLSATLTTYQATVSSGQIRFPREFLHAQGAEADDFILLRVDVKGHVMDVAFGDEDVFEKIKAPSEHESEHLDGDSGATRSLPQIIDSSGEEVA